MVSILPFTSYDTADLSGEPLQKVYCQVRDVAEYLLIGNPKKHDVHSSWLSFVEYGFTDPSKWDEHLNEGKGGFSHGNGRIKALHWAESNGQLPPRGIMLTAQGAWCMPILFGVNARDQQHALAYSINHNNLTLAGGEFTPLDISRLYDADGYTALLKELADNDELPPVLDGDDLDLLVEQLNKDADGRPPTSRFDEDNDAPPISSGGTPLAIVLDSSELKEWQIVKESLGVSSDRSAFLKLMRGE